jgi:hypothetical protein
MVKKKKRKKKNEKKKKKKNGLGAGSRPNFLNWQLC